MPAVVSYWTPTTAEVEAIKAGEPVALWVAGMHHAARDVDG